MQRVVSDFSKLRYRLTNDFALDYHLVAVSVHTLITVILRAENAGLSRTDIRSQLDAVRRLHAESPMIARMQDWPSGYAGDHKTIDLILSGRPVSPVGSLAYYLERFLLDSSASQQHRNKVAVQADVIRWVIRNNADATILIIACGGCPDLQLLADELSHFRGQFWLNDINGEALSDSIKALDRIRPTIQPVNCNVVELMRQGAHLPNFDLILAGGLFDYLESRLAQFVIKRSYGLLRDRGKMFFTNIGCNPYRAWMEYCGEWCLIERDAQCLRSLANQAGVPDHKVSISSEPSGLTHLVELRK